MAVPGQPTISGLTVKGSNAILIEWGAVATATGYYVYQSEDDITYSRIKDTTDVDFTPADLNENTQYYFKVSAYNGDGEGTRSASANDTTEAEDLEDLYIRSEGPLPYDRNFWHPTLQDKVEAVTAGILRSLTAPIGNDDVLRKGDLTTIFAPGDAQYVVLALSGELSAERRLQVGSGLSLTDGGANGDVTIAFDPAYGEISVKDNASVTTLNSTGGKVQLTDFDTDGESNNMTPSNANDHIEVDRDGIYLCTFSVSLNNQAGASHIVSMSVWKNNGGTEFANLHAHQTLGAGTDRGSVSISGIANLSDGDTIEVWANTDRAVDSDVVFEDMTLSLVQIG